MRSKTKRNTQRLKGFDGKTVKVHLQGVIAFKWVEGTETYYLLPCVDDKGVCDTERMEIVGDIHTQEERSSRQ